MAEPIRTAAEMLEAALAIADGYFHAGDGDVRATAATIRDDVLALRSRIAPPPPAGERHKELRERIERVLANPPGAKAVQVGTVLLGYKIIVEELLRDCARALEEK